MARVKTDWRANLSTPRLSDLMRRFQPNARSSFVVDAGTRARRPRIQPYGPRQRQMNAIVHVDDDGDDDDTQE